MADLPPELWEHVFLFAPEQCYDGTLLRVCRKWRGVVRSIRSFLRSNRFYAYSNKWISPKTFKTNGSIYCLVEGHDGNIYTGTHEAIHKWSVDGTCLLIVEGHHSMVTQLAVDRDGRIFSGGWYDNTIKVWSDNCFQTFGEGFTYTVCSIAIDPKNERIYSGTRNGTIVVWNVDGSRSQTLYGHTRHVTEIKFGPNGHAHSGSNDKTVRVWNGAGKNLLTLTNDDEVSAIAVGNDEKIYSGTRHGKIWVWDRSGENLRILTGHSGVIFSLVIGGDDTLFSGGRDGTIRVWSGSKGLLHILYLDRPVFALTLIGGRLYSASGSTIQIWQ